MRNGSIALSLSLALTLSCGDDEPKRPEDGTVKVWESCAWDGQVVPELCESGLACTYHGVCAPTCSEAACPTFDGFEVECNPFEMTQICEPRCNDAQECPDTKGTALHCLDFYCIGDV